MSRRLVAQGVALAIAVSGVSAGPAVAFASSGGGGLAPSASASTSSASTSTRSGSSSTPQPANQIVRATGAGMTIATRASVVLRRLLRVSGRVPMRYAGETVEIERRGRQTHWAWAPTTSAVVGSDGTFSALWHVNHIGRFTLRAVLQSASRARATFASPSLTVTVFRPSLATIYGPGLYGNRTACGQVLSSRTIGVANRTLPCGTPVAILYHGQTLIVPVVDRGPYGTGADWDITSATAAELGMSGTDTVRAVSLPSPS